MFELRQDTEVSDGGVDTVGLGGNDEVGGGSDVLGLFLDAEF